MIDTDTAQEPDAQDLPASEPVEIVERPQADPPAVREKSALEHAAEELMGTPGAPGRDEFLVLATTARILSMSAGAPKAVRNNPWLAFHLALIGRDLGISPSAAIAQIDVIGEGENAQLSLSPELLNGQIKRMGLGSIVKAASRDTECTAVALLPGGRVDYRCARIWPDHVPAEDERGHPTPGGPCSCTLDRVLGDVTFTWDDAQQAGLAHRDCAGPSTHTDICVGGKDSQGKYRPDKRCHQGYRTYPKRMMWWRSASWCQSDFFPEASIGIYQAEELGAVVDPEGRPYDPATVALPEGYEEPGRPHDPTGDRLADAEPEVHASIMARGAAIAEAGDEPRKQLGALWAPAGLPSPADLLVRERKRAEAILASIEKRIQAGEWGDTSRETWQQASPPAETPTEDAVSQPESAADAETGEPTPETAEALETPQERPSVETVPQPSTRAQAVKRAKAAVDEMADEQVREMVLAYDHEPIDDPAGRRGQLVALMADEEMAAES